MFHIKPTYFCWVAFAPIAVSQLSDSSILSSSSLQSFSTFSTSPSLSTSTTTSSPSTSVASRDPISDISTSSESPEDPSIAVSTFSSGPDSSSVDARIFPFLQEFLLSTSSSTFQESTSNIEVSSTSNSSISSPPSTTSSASQPCEACTLELSDRTLTYPTEISVKNVTATVLTSITVYENDIDINTVTSFNNDDIAILASASTNTSGLLTWTDGDLTLTSGTTYISFSIFGGLTTQVSPNKPIDGDTIPFSTTPKPAINTASECDETFLTIPETLDSDAFVFDLTGEDGPFAASVTDGDGTLGYFISLDGIEEQLGGQNYVDCADVTRLFARPPLTRPLTSAAYLTEVSGPSTRTTVLGPKPTDEDTDGFQGGLEEEEEEEDDNDGEDTDGPSIGGGQSRDGSIADSNSEDDEDGEDDTSDDVGDRGGGTNRVNFGGNDGSGGRGGSDGGSDETEVSSSNGGSGQGSGSDGSGSGNGSEGDDGNNDNNGEPPSGSDDNDDLDGIDSGGESSNNEMSGSSGSSGGNDNSSNGNGGSNGNSGDNNSNNGGGSSSGNDSNDGLSNGSENSSSNDIDDIINNTEGAGSGGGSGGNVNIDESGEPSSPADNDDNSSNNGENGSSNNVENGNDSGGGSNGASNGNSEILIVDVGNESFTVTPVEEGSNQDNDSSDINISEDSNDNIGVENSNGNGDSPGIANDNGSGNGETIGGNDDNVDENGSGNGSTGGSADDGDNEDGIVIDSQTIRPGETAIVNNVPVALLPSGNSLIIDGARTEPVAFATASFGLDEEEDVLSIPAAPAGVFTVDSFTASISDSQLIIGPGTTLTAGEVVTVDGTRVSLDNEGEMAVVGTSTVDLGSVLATAAVITAVPSVVPITVDSLIATISDSQLIVGPGTVLGPGEAVTVDGTRIFLDEDGSSAVIGTNVVDISSVLATAAVAGTTSLPAIVPITVGSITATISDTQLILGSGTTLTPGEIATVDGTPISLDEDGSSAIIGTSTVDIASVLATAAAAPITSGGGSTISPPPPQALVPITIGSITATISDTQLILAPGTTLMPGEIATVDGTPVSLDEDGSAAIIGGTSTVDFDSVFATASITSVPLSPSDEILPTITILDSLIATISGTELIIGAGNGGRTLTPGEVITLDRTPISLDEDGGGTVFVGTSVIDLATVPGVATATATATGDVFADDDDTAPFADSAAAAVISPIKKSTGESGWMSALTLSLAFLVGMYLF